MKKILKVALMISFVFIVLLSLNANTLNAAKDTEFKIYYSRTEKNLLLNSSGTKKHTATARVKNGDKENINYSIDNTEKASIDENGKVTINDEGKFVVTATYSENGESATQTIYAYKKDGYGVKVNGTEVEEYTLNVGDTAQVEGILPDWAKQEDVQLFYKSGSRTRVSINKETGEIKGMRAGSSTISVYVESENGNSLRIDRIRINVKGEGDLNNTETKAEDTDKKEEVLNSLQAKNLDKIYFYKEDGKTKDYVRDYPLGVGQYYEFKILDKEGNVVSNQDLKYEITSGDIDSFEIIETTEGPSVYVKEGDSEAKLKISLKNNTKVDASVKIGSAQSVESIQFVQETYTIQDKGEYEFYPIITLQNGEVLDPRNEGVKESEQYQAILETLTLTEVDGDGNDKENTADIVKIKSNGITVQAKQSGNCYLEYKSTVLNSNVTAKTELQISLIGEKGDMVKSLYNVLNEIREKNGLKKLNYTDKAEPALLETMKVYIESYDTTGKYDMSQEVFDSYEGHSFGALLQMEGINFSAANRSGSGFCKSFEDIANLYKEGGELSDWLLFSSDAFEYVSIVIEERNGEFFACIGAFGKCSNGKKMDVVRYIDTDNSVSYKSEAKLESNNNTTRKIGQYVNVTYKFNKGMAKYRYMGSDYVEKKDKQFEYWFIDSNNLTEINPLVDRTNATKIEGDKYRWTNEENVELRTYPSYETEMLYKGTQYVLGKDKKLEVIEKYPNGWCLVKYNNSYLYVDSNKLTDKKQNNSSNNSNNDNKDNSNDKSSNNSLTVKKDIQKNINDVRWAVKDNVALRSYPTFTNKVSGVTITDIARVDKGTEIYIMDKYTDNWCSATYNGQTVYVFANDLTDEKP